MEASAATEATELATLRAGLEPEEAAELATLRTGLEKLARQQVHVLRDVPPPLAALVPSRGWQRCVASIDAVDSGYEAARQKRRRKNAAEPCATPAASRRVLVSAFDLERGGGEEKQRVDALLAAAAAAHLPALGEQMAADPDLVLLLLDAPSCATTAALAVAVPALRGLASRICIPQADPSHYDLMINRHAEPADRQAPRVPPLLNVRWQRLDAWLSSHAGLGLRVPVFFADYETSVYGRASVQLSPLRDLQRFLRGGFAADVCLLGVTLSYREAHAGRYDGPKLEPEHVADFVATEAAAQGFGRCELLEELRYGMTFSLFLLRRGS